MAFLCGILKGCNAHGWHCVLTSGPCSGMADSEVAGNSVSPSASFKGSGLGLPNTGGLVGTGFSHASVLTSYRPLSLS